MFGILTRTKELIRASLGRMGYQITRIPAAPPQEAPLPFDFDASDCALIRMIQPYTLTSPEETFALLRAVEYLVRANIPGDFVECGVWKGGSSMAMALTLMKEKSTNRHLYLYDTFDAGWPEGGPEDVMFDGTTAHELWLRALESGQTPDTLFGKFANVAEVMKSTGYPYDQIHMVKGKVEDTIPATIPERIALLRLDTDWYESTRHELVHLYPRLTAGGVLIIDDYASFKGSQKAADEYFAEHGITPLLNRTDGRGLRIMVKTAPDG